MIAYSCYTNEDYVWVSLGNAMNAKQMTNLNNLDADHHMIAIFFG